MTARTPQHGTVTEYNRFRCRCDDCRTARRDAQRAYRARHRPPAPPAPAPAPEPCQRRHVESVVQLLAARSRALSIPAAQRTPAGRDARARRAEVLDLLETITGVAS